MEYTFTNDDVKLVEQFIDIKNKGFYADGKQVTDVYNRVLHKNLPPTNCGSCIRQRVIEMEAALMDFKNKIEFNENKAQEDMKEKMARVRAAKQNKK